MAPREDLISSAITFLQDPSVASAPVEKQIEFLKSKNLTQEEIEISLGRANDGNPSHYSSPPPNAQYYPPQPYQRPPPGYNYPYNPYGDWQQPPPEVPRRDWRDWFIMATVVGGAGYGLWTLTQRYVKPLIAPPTPPQLEQDKAAIDEQFNRAFALLDTLSADTAALKEAEEARTKRLDSAISDVEAIVADLKAANLRREDESRRMELEVKGMRDSLPRAIDSVRESSEKQLRELGTELGSLKLLIGNRMAGSSAAPFASNLGLGLPPRQQTDGLANGRSGTGSPATETAPGSNTNTTGVNSGFSYPTAFPTIPVPSASAPSRPKSSAPFGSSSGKAAIPAWQMAASNKAKDIQNPSPAAPDGMGTGPQTDGAEAVAALAAS